MKRLQAIVPDELHKRVKLKATEQDKTVTQVIVELIKEWLEKQGDINKTK